MDAFHAELLGALRTHLGRPDLRFAAQPTLLTGGFFTENHAFELAEAPAGWETPLVVRLFPPSAPTDLPAREVAVQRALTAQGYPAAPVVWFDENARLDRRPYFVMQRLAGRAIVGGLGPGALLRAARFTRPLPRVTADVQAQLHRLDATELAVKLASTADGVARSLSHLDAAIERGADGFVAARSWLVGHRPAAAERAVVCHGDLWGGNILIDSRGRVTGVLDWSTSSIAEPAFDVGATALAFCFVPLRLPDAVRTMIEHRGRAMYARYLRAYEAQRAVDLRARPYYEALRCAAELAFVAAWRQSSATGDERLRSQRPPWDVIPGALQDFFETRTGVRITLPSYG